MKKYTVNKIHVSGCFLLLFLLILISMHAVSAAEIVNSGKCGPDASWTLTKDGTLTVSGTGEMDDYNYIGDNENEGSISGNSPLGDDVQPPWRSYSKSITSVVIREGITHISHCGFTRCVNLKQVTFPDSLLSIGFHSFAYCGNLKNVTLPEKLEEIGFSAFADTGLTSVSIPVRTHFYTDAFSGPSFREFQVDATTVITEIDEDGCEHTMYPNYRAVDGVLYSNDMSRLLNYPSGKGGDYTLPDSVRYVAAGALSVYEPIHRFVIPNADVEINLDAGSVRAREVVLPEGMEEIPEGMFDCAPVEKITIPESLKRIGHNAFNGCSHLKEVALPDGVTEIGDCAFTECTSLEHLNLPASLTYIGDLAFYGCKNWIDPVTVPGGVKEINMWAFMGCRSIPFAALKDGVQTIGPGVFSGCSNLRAVFIPVSVTDVKQNAVRGCSLLKDIYYEGNGTEWQKINIENSNYGNDPLLTGRLHTDGDLAAIEKQYDPVGGFMDVLQKDYFSGAVLWAVGHGITKGTSDTTFSPEDTCTRGQAVTFLWRANGSEIVTGVANPFSDVRKTDYYYDAVLWAVKNGITKGMTDNTFVPDADCNRGQIVTFLWRSMKEPASNAPVSFTDVAQKDFYYMPVRWAVENDVTKGTSTKTFSPADPCTRGQIVTFLYRALS